MTRPRPNEAPLVETEGGLSPEGDGWFVVNLSDARAIASEDAGHAWPFEGAPRIDLPAGGPKLDRLRDLPTLAAHLGSILRAP